MKTVKLTTTDGILKCENGTSQEKGIWGDYQFICNKPIDECDFWVIHDGVPREMTVKVPPENVIFITGEPYAKYHYHPNFLKQFGTVIAFEKSVKGANVIYGQPMEQWSVGRKTLTGKFEDIMPYDKLKGIKNFKKDKLISVCVSNKAFYPQQVKRLEFVNKLSKKMDIDVFGTNIRDLDDKWDALERYKYHISLENFISDDYFTCKLTDAILGGCYPFYCGAGNIYEYFSNTEIQKINIDNFNLAYALIEDAIKNNRYDKCVEDIDGARNKRRAEKAINELSQGRNKERKVA